MANRIDAYLGPGEVVIYRTPRVCLPRGLRHFLYVPAIFAGLSLASGLIELDPSGKATLLTVAILVVFFAIIYIISARSTAMAVTEGRVLRFARFEDQTRFESIPLGEIGTVRILGRIVTVTNRAGDVTIDHSSDHALEIGRALANAAKLPPPRTPGWPDAVADYGLVLAAVGGFYGVLSGIMRALAAMGLLPIPYPACLAASVPIILLSLAGALAGLVVGLIVARHAMDPVDFQRWMHGQTLRFDCATDPEPPSRIAPWLPRLIDRLFGPLPTQNAREP